jgi:biotin carboxylase
MTDGQKTILFVGGGIETLPGLDLAKSMGLYVVVSDINSQAPCMLVADACLIADTYNEKDTLSAAKKFHDTQRNIDGVICLASDIPLTVATVAAGLNLPGIPISSAKIVSDKILMKDCFKEFGLPIPKYQEIYSAKELKVSTKLFGFPLVVKPVDSRGARGVLKVTKDIDIEWAYASSKSFSPSGRVMIEEYMQGPQISTESLVVNGNVFTIGFSDRNYEFLEKYAPNMIENGGDLPSHLKKSEQSLICHSVERTAKALNIYNGVIKGDMVLSNGNPYIIEVAARLSGGYFCSHEIPLNTGVDFVGNAIKIALGEEVKKSELEVNSNNAISQRYFFPKPGRVVKIEIPEWIKLKTTVIMCEIRVKVGDIIPKATQHPARAGVVICTGNDLEEAKQLVKKVINEVLIETVP